MLSFANLAATLAVFLVLSLGYASAFSGSGTLQKGSLKNIPTTQTTVRTITGIGSILSRCSPGLLRVSIENDSGTTLRAALGAGSQFFNQEISDGGSFEVSPTVNTHLRYHVHPVDGSKRPQADIDLTVNNTETCSTSQVTALVLNTEE
jgi:hypothetical protein